MIKRDIKIEGLDCANCARELEELLEKIDGVNAVAVDFIQQKVRFSGEEDALAKVIDCCNNFEEVKVTEVEGAPQAKDKMRDGKRIKIANLCCANCARELEEELNKIDGVEATVDFMNMCVILKCASGQSYEKAIHAISHFEDVKIVDGKEQSAGVIRQNLKTIIGLICGVVFFIPALVLDLLHLDGGWYIASCVLYGLSFVSAGYPVLIKTVLNLAHGRIFDENFLMTIASVGAIVLGAFTGDGYMEGAAVMVLYQAGELLQSIAVGSSRKSIASLMDIKSETANLYKDGEWVIVAPESLTVGDRIMIKAGEKIPVDCRILSGETLLDMKSLNGEAIPKEVKAGDEILSGAINSSKVVEAEVIREYEDSAVAKILELVENSTAKKAKPEKFITKFAKYYTPAVVLAALIVAGLVPTIICAVNASFVWETYSGWIYKSLSFLVISCPCALVISVPLAYFGGIGRCARSGILVKGSTCIDTLATYWVAAFDKTGTLTEGRFAVISSSSEQALQLAACAEKYSSHPIAAAFENVQSDYVAEDVEEIVGRGVKCLVNCKKLLCGNAALISENGVSFTPVHSTATLVYVALDGEYVGVIEIDDRIKEDAKATIDELKILGVDKCVMLTGDSNERAQAVAEKIGLDGADGGLLPDGKLELARHYAKRGALLYVGDGINDAPVMAAADCAVSMGKFGSDAAIEASDVVLVDDKLSLLAEARKVAKSTRRIVFENIIGSLAVKFAIMAMGIAIPAFPLIIAIFGDVGVMLLAVLNSLRTALIK